MSFFNAQTSFLSGVFQTNMQASCYNYGYSGIDRQDPFNWAGHRQMGFYTKHYDRTGQHQLAYVARSFKDATYDRNTPPKDPNAICTDRYYRGKNVTNAKAKKNHEKTRKKWHDRCDWP
eukprot:209969_1